VGRLEGKREKRYRKVTLEKKLRIKETDYLH
jgi:hypothetical protein